MRQDTIKTAKIGDGTSQSTFIGPLRDANVRFVCAMEGVSVDDLTRGVASANVNETVTSGMGTMTGVVRSGTPRQNLAGTGREPGPRLCRRGQYHPLNAIMQV